ncbi:MAG: AI-2E family transporter [Eubacteriales bacterium]|jgi:predicted PurR-regulated permease PerM|nr:AI-2E family transporter [Eubacteriales bacterium]
MKRKILFFVICALAAAFMVIARSALRPLYIALVLTYLILPVVKKLERSGVKRIAALVFTYTLLVFIVIAVFWIGVPFLLSGVKSLQKAVSDYLLDIDMPFDIPISFEELIEQFASLGMEYIGGAVNKLISTINFVFNVILGMVLSFYMILDREKIANSLISLVPVGARRRVFNIAGKVDVVLKKFVLGQLAVAASLSAISFPVLLLMRIKYAFILAILLGILEFVPYFGAFLSAFPAVVIAASQSPVKALWVVLAYIGIQQLESVYISPKILGGSFGIHPIITIMSVVVGGHIFGLFGMVLAVPVVGIIQAVIGEIIEALDEGDLAKDNI